MNIGAKCEKTGYFAGSASISATLSFLNTAPVRASDLCPVNG